MTFKVTTVHKRPVLVSTVNSMHVLHRRSQMLLDISLLFFCPFILEVDYDRFATHRLSFWLDRSGLSSLVLLTIEIIVFSSDFKAHSSAGFSCLISPNPTQSMYGYVTRSTPAIFCNGLNLSSFTLSTTPSTLILLARFPELFLITLLCSQPRLTHS